MTKNREIRYYGKECTISGKLFDANEDNFYVNSNSPDGLHPYSKYADNYRRTTEFSTKQLRRAFAKYSKLVTNKS